MVEVQKFQVPKDSHFQLWSLTGGTMPSLPLERHMTVFRRCFPVDLLISTSYFSTLFSRFETIFMLLTFRLYNLVYKNLSLNSWHGVPHFSLCDVLLILRLVTGFASLLISPPLGPSSSISLFGFLFWAGLMGTAWCELVLLPQRSWNPEDPT